MMGVAVASHAIGAVVFSVSTTILLRHKITRTQAPLLVVACFFTSLWSFLCAVYASSIPLHYAVVAISEVIRNFVWVLCVIQLIGITQQHTAQASRFHLALKLCFGLLTGVLCITALSIKSQWMPGFSGVFAQYTFVGNIVLSIAILGLIEQLYRGNVPERRWGLKFLCLGVGGLYTFDFFLYANGILFAGIRPSLWEIRGLACAVLAPFILISALRHHKWHSDLTPSRTFIVHSTIFFLCGIYLLVMGGVAAYLRNVGGHWGPHLQAFFLFGAIVLLGTLLFSGKIRSFLALTLAKHFFKFRYDYRYEWERLTRLLTDKEDYLSLEQRMIKAVAELVQSPKGVLYTYENNRLQKTRVWNISNEKCPKQLQEQTCEYIQLNTSPFIISECSSAAPDVAKSLMAIPDAWLVLPINHGATMIGVIVLAAPRVEFTMNWEVKDFLSLAGLQIGVCLAQANDAKALMNAKKFEAMNQISAFVIHDIKNIISQLKFIQTNKAIHGDNPEFIKSVYRTVEASTVRLESLHKKVLENKQPTLSHSSSWFNLHKALTCVIQMTSGHTPRLQVQGIEHAESILLTGEMDEFSDVLTHLVNNAQQATSNDGFVRLCIEPTETNLILELADSGSGMSEEFIRNQLFEPFVSTKGEKGMGIGAFQAKKLIEKMNGTIEVSSKPGVGSTFKIALPFKFVQQNRSQAQLLDETQRGSVSE